MRKKFPNGNHHSVAIWQRWVVAILVSGLGLGSVSHAQDTRSPSEIDGSRLSRPDQADDGGTSLSGASAGDSRRNQAGQVLTRELDNLIPGEFESGGDDEKLVEEIVASFQAREGAKVIEKIETLVKRNGDYPPADVLLAALSYASQDEQTGLLLLERASLNHPEDPAVYSAFARLAINNGRTTDAKVLFEKLQSVLADAKLSETAVEFYRTQYLDGMIDIAIKQKRLDDARAMLEQQRQRLPNHPKVLMVSAELEFKEDNLDQCLQYLSQMKEKFPNTRVPEAIMASWYQRTEQPDEAETWIRKASEKYPNDAQVQLEYASWALNQEDFPTASAAVGKAEKVTRETPFSKNLKAKIAFARQSYGIAESHYESLVVTQPMDSDLSNMYALSLIESNDPDKRSKAVGIANRNFRAMPNNRVALASLGYIQLRMGDMEQAGAIFTRASQGNDGTSPEIDFFIASYLKEAGEVAKAKQFLERAVSKDGLFLYRSAAKKMLDELNASELPRSKQ